MSWKCINDVYNEKHILLFIENKIYEEQDDRGEADDIAICLCDEFGVKRYLVDNFVRNNFIDLDDVIGLLKKNIHDEIVNNDGQSEKYFENYWLVWWGLMSTDCKNGLIKTLLELKK